MISWLTRLWRLLTAATAHRNVEHEQDENDGAPRAVSDLADEPDTTALVVPPPVPPIVIGSDGWVSGEKVVRIPTARSGYRWRGTGGRPSGCLWHWTATNHGTALAMVKRTAKIGEGGSVHFWIEHDGTIYQSVPLTRGAGHAGAPSSARMKVVGGELVIVSREHSKHSANSFLVGIEIVNVGEVRQVDGKWMGWPFGKDGRKGPVVKTPVIEAEDRTGRRRHYQAYTPQQLEAVERLMRAFRAVYGWNDRAMSWGHLSVDGTRKSDPGWYFLSETVPALLAKL